MASDDERRGGGAGRTVGDALLVEQERRGAGAGLLQDAQERGVDTAEGVEQEDQDDGRVDAQLPRERSAAGDGVEQEDQGEGRVDAPLPRERADAELSAAADDVEQEDGVDGPVPQERGAVQREQEERRADDVVDGGYWFLDENHVHQAVLVCGAVLFLYVSGKLLLRASAFFLAASAAAQPTTSRTGVRSVLNTWVFDSFLSMVDPEKNVCAALGGNYGDRPASSCHVEGKRGAVAPPMIQILLMIVAVVAFLQGFL